MTSCKLHEYDATVTYVDYGYLDCYKIDINITLLTQIIYSITILISNICMLCILLSTKKSVIKIYFAEAQF